MELISVYKDDLVLKAEQNQLPELLEKGWSTEKPAPKATQAAKPAPKPAVKAADNADS